MSSNTRYISIFDKPLGLTFGAASNIEQSDSGYRAVANSSYDGFERSCRALGRPTFVVIYESMITEPNELDYLKSILSGSGVPWLVAECEEISYSAINTEATMAVGYTHSKLTLNELLNSNIPLPLERDGQTERQLGACSISVDEAGLRTHKVPLTPRQEEVYNLVLRGLSNKRIARALGISESTVKEHITGILQRLGLKTRVEALSRALVPHQ